VHAERFAGVRRQWGVHRRNLGVVGNDWRRRFLLLLFFNLDIIV